MMKTVIMAGGKGTRISSIASDIPKPMIRIDEEKAYVYGTPWSGKENLIEEGSLDSWN